MIVDHLTDGPAAKPWRPSAQFEREPTEEITPSIVAVEAKPLPSASGKVVMAKS